jgi:2-dehydro-3-deoxygalactonokinase
MSFVAVDWGSTRFRAYRVETGGVSDRITSERGIGSTPPEELAATLAAQLAPWRPWIEGGRVPVRMAGMIGSNRGLRDAGYQRLPIDLDALASADALVDVATPLATRVSIRAGLALARDDEFDVMRGEEVQLYGAQRLRPASLYVFPGTHSKWVPVEHGSGRAQVRTFSTMMTGELHRWLVEDSMVCRGIPAESGWSADAFARGVARARAGGDIVEETFRTRARWLLGGLGPEAAPSFLSGLLIGHEIDAMTRRYQPAGPTIVVGEQPLSALYVEAMGQLGLAAETLAGEVAFIEGLRRIHHG